MRTDTANSAGLDPFKIVSFDLVGQRFGIDIMSVREIRGWTPASPLPHAPDFVRGVINLRGEILPVVDLSARLGFRQSEPTVRHGVIITEMPDGSMIGLLVDAVSDIVEISQDAVRPTPDVASTATKDFVRGIVARQDSMLSVLNVGSPALGAEDMAGLEASLPSQ